MIKRTFIGLICLCSAVFAAESGAKLTVTKNITHYPAKAKFVYTDVENFAQAFAMMADNADTLGIIQTEYLDKGTPGLAMFLEKYPFAADDLRDAIRKHPEQYASMGTMVSLLKAEENDWRAAYAKLKEFIPQIVYPPTYFVVEVQRGIGSGSVEGQLISVDKWKEPISDERTMLVHELTHFQQVVAITYEEYVKLFHEEKSLLGLCIREGTAEFFAELVTGEMTQDEAVEFTLANEKRLWEWFFTEKDGRETGDWMWSQPADSTQPRHVGYVLGSLIVKSYYDHAIDKAKAVDKILNVRDYNAFLERSRYAEKFE